jgi:ABC-type transporter Mla subunit MlaD
METLSMIDETRIPQVMNELIEVLQLQAKQIEKLIVHVERHTDRVNYPQEMPLVVSELSALHRRMAMLIQNSEPTGQAR